MEEIILFDLQIYPFPQSIASKTPLPNLGDSMPSVELILICSSGEFGVLQQVAIADWLARDGEVRRKPRRTFVSMACASWYAALLEFRRSDCSSAEIWVLEATADFIQERLDSAGLGHKGEGLLAIPGVARMCLHKGKALPGQIILDTCVLLSKPEGLRGTERLIKRYLSWLRIYVKEGERVDWISFSINTDWSRRLEAGFAAWIGKSAQSFVSLPSLEQGKNHFMAMKPLYELSNHLQQPLSRPVVLTTLAAGGRIGSAIFRKKDLNTQISGQWPKNISPIPLPPVMLATGKPPYYCSREYFYCENAYFLTELD